MGYHSIVKTQDIWKRFSESFPRISKRVVEWYPSRAQRIVIFLDDGQKLLYDYNRNNYAIIPKDRKYTSIDNTMFKKLFVASLKKKIEEADISYSELARRVGISIQSVSAYARGCALPSMYTCVLIANALNCSVAELIDFP